MSKGFEKFKKRIFRAVFIKSAAYALSLGLTVSAVLAVLSRREIISLGLIYVALIGLGTALVAGTVLWLVLRPSDRKVARMIDREFSLGERTETMTAFMGQSGAMIELQREDTEQRLDRIPVTSFRIRRVAAAVVVLAISVGLLAGSFAVPALADTPPDEVIVDGYEKDWRIAALTALIERVRSDAYAEQGLKDGLVSEIEELIENVRATDKEAVMTAAAVKTVGAVRALEDGYDSYDELGSSLTSLSDTLLQKLGKAVLSLDDTAFADAVELIIDSFSADGLEQDVSEFNDKLGSALRATELVREGDALLISLTSFENALATVSDTMPSDAMSRIEDAASALIDSGYDVLLQQSDNVRLTNIVVNEIISVFSLSDEDLAGGGVELPSDTEVPDTDQDKEDDDEADNNAGGMGTGETLVGSNDYVYDPDEDAYVRYADVLNKYYAIFDSSASEYPDELTDEAQKYFSALFTPEDLQ